MSIIIAGGKTEKSVTINIHKCKRWKRYIEDISLYHRECLLRYRLTSSGVQWARKLKGSWIKVSRFFEENVVRKHRCFRLIELINSTDWHDCESLLSLIVHEIRRYSPFILSQVFLSLAQKLKLLIIIEVIKIIIFVTHHHLGINKINKHEKQKWIIAAKKFPNYYDRFVNLNPKFNED